MKEKVLILCTGNSCRSHMAEGILRARGGDFFEVFSAGSNPKGAVHPFAIQALSEIGIDIKHHTSDHLNLYINKGIDVVITVCDNAQEACPIFPNSPKTYHWSFEDPPHAAQEGESEIEAFRRIRDQIKLVFEAYVSGYQDAKK